MIDSGLKSPALPILTFPRKGGRENILLGVLLRIIPSMGRETGVSLQRLMF